MTAIYHTINSNSSLDTHPQNHGGDFTIEFSEQMHFPGNWEVALVEMVYYGQNFPNLAAEYGEVSIEATESSFESQFVLHYHETGNLSITIHIRDNTDWIYTDTIKFDQKHYSWQDLEKAFVKNRRVDRKNTREEYELRFLFGDKNMVIIGTLYATQVKLTFSDSFVQQLGLADKYYTFMNRNETEIKYITISKIPVKKDESHLIFTPAIIEPIWFKINGSKLTIPNLYWTQDTLNEALKLLVKEVYPTLQIELYFVVNKEGLFTFLIHNKQDKTLTIEVSEFIQNNMDFSKKGIYAKAIQLFSEVHDYTSNLIFFPLDEDKVKAIEPHFEATFNLPFNFYPDAGSLVSDLNMLVMEHINKLIDKQQSAQFFDQVFTLLQDKKCKFQPVENYKITLSSYLVNILQLTSLTEANISKKDITLLPAQRAYFNVYSSVVEPHFVNQEQLPLLRVINNRAKQSERVMLTFPLRQYYPLSRTYFPNIHFYITDDFSTDPLQFNKPVTYLLHFRPCPASDL